VNGRLPITPALLLTANYTYTDSVRKGGGEPAFDGSSLDGTPLDKTPRHMANVRLDWQATEQIAAYVLGYYSGRLSAGSATARSTPAPVKGARLDVGINFTINEISR
jgi:outer membrane receptor for ferrienterochelin and colicins